MNWHFHRGEWKEIPDPLPEKDDWEAALKEAGYDAWPAAELGELGTGLHAAVYGSSAVYGGEKPEYPWVVLLGLDSRTDDVYVSDLPSLYQLLASISPAIQLESAGRRERERERER